MYLKGRTKTVIIIVNVNVIVEKPRESTDMVLELKEFSRFARYALDMQKSTAFLYTGENREKEFIINTT